MTGPVQVTKATPAAERIRVQGVSKLFGPNGTRALALAREGLDKVEVLRETGCTIAVNDVSFSVAPGEIFVVMGLSGSGKSTLVRCLNRLLTADAGVVEIDGEDICRMNDEQLRAVRLGKITMVFQHFALLPHRTVAENAEYGLKMRGMAPAARRAKAMEALDAVGLAPWADRLPSDLSGGMRQRVGLARALALDPGILLMDEPFGALDPLIRQDMQKELLELQRRRQTTIIFITHDLNEALTLGDRIAVMKDGRFSQVGTPAEIVLAPADDYVASFTREIDRARVLPLRTALRGSTHDAADTLPALPADTRLIDALTTLAQGPVRVVGADGASEGIVTAGDVAAIMAPPERG